MSTENEEQGGMGYIELGAWVKDPTDIAKQAWDGESGPKIPPGQYLVDITEAERNVNGKNNPQVQVQFTVAEGEQAGATLRGWYVLTEKAIGRVLNLLQACGLALDARGGFDVAALVGSRLYITVVENTYEAGENPVTGEKITKTNSKVMGEKAYVPPAPPKKAAAGAPAKK